MLERTDEGTDRVPRRSLVATLVTVTILVTVQVSLAASPARQRIRDLKDRLAAVERSLADADAKLADAEAENSFVGAQRDIAVDTREEAEHQATVARADAQAWRATTYALLAAIAVAGVIIMLRRRNTIRIQIPDTPQELLEASEPPGLGDR